MTRLDFIFKHKLGEERTAFQWIPDVMNGGSIRLFMISITSTYNIYIITCVKLGRIC